MAKQKVTKKNTTSVKQSISKAAQLKKSVKKYLVNTGSSIRLRSSQVIMFFKAIPGWLKRRPAAIKHWIKEDKKKKKYRSFHLQKKLKPEPRYIPSVGRLLRTSLKFMWTYKWKFLGMILLHFVLFYVLLKGPVTSSIDAIQKSLADTAQTGAKSTTGILATLGTAITSGSTSSSNPTVSTVLFLLISLSYVWLIRQLHTDKKVKIRDAIYNGPATLIPVLLVLLVLALQAIPFSLATFVYSLARSSSTFVSGVEDMLAFIIVSTIGILSFYWITSTIIALYVVSLQGMYPKRALKVAKKLVQFQRLKVFGRIFGGALAFGVFYFALLIITVRFFSSKTYLAIDILPLFLLPVVHVYLYKLYRTLI